MREWTGVLVSTADAHTDGWHAARAQGVGGSEVAAILGLSPWESPFSLWHAKANGWTSDPNPEMEWGNRLEPLLVDWYFEHAVDVERVEPCGLYVHRTRRWQRASPDGLGAGPDGVRLVEAKKASSDDDWGTPGSDEIPPYYRVQVVWYMDVLGVDRADVVVTNLGRAPEVYTVTYDPAEARLLRGHAAAFWRSLQHGRPPELDGTVHTLRTVRRLHPLIDGGDVEVDVETAGAWLRAKGLLAAAEQSHRVAASRLLTAMGTARRALTPDGVPFARRQPGRGESVALYPIGASK